MTATPPPPDPSGVRASPYARGAVDGGAENDGRQTRVLKAARELLLQRGYARVTVEDISRRSRIGKGTVYLHWESKAALVEEVLFTETVGVTVQMADGMRADPREILFHRVARQNFRQVLRRPLYRALYMRDRDVLGRFLDERAPRLNEFRNRLAWAYQQYHAVLREAELVATDVPFDQAMVALDALCTGMVLRLQAFADVEPVAALPDSEEVLALTVARAFGPLVIPTMERLRDAAEQIAPIFDEPLAPVRSMVLAPPAVGGVPLVVGIRSSSSSVG